VQILIKINWKELFESIGLLAIILSLVFVGFQIKQDQLLTRSELGAGSAKMAAEISMMAIESEFQRTFVKMISQPDQLTDEEVVEIRFFLSAMLQMMIRECYLMDRGVFVECENAARFTLRNNFENEFAKNWLLSRSGTIPYMPDWFFSEIAELDTNGNLRRIEESREPYNDR